MKNNIELKIEMHASMFLFLNEENHNFVQLNNECTFPATKHLLNFDGIWYVNFTLWFFTVSLTKAKLRNLVSYRIKQMYFILKWAYKFK